MTNKITRSTRFEDLPDVLTVEEVGRFLGIGRNSAYDLANGDLRGLRIGARRLIVLKAALGSFLGVSKSAGAGTR